MLIPHVRARRAVAVSVPTLAAVATLAGCGASSPGGPKWTDAGASHAASPSRPRTRPAGLPRRGHFVRRPRRLRRSRPSPTTQSTAAAPPAGTTYADRLPKFDRPPKADKVNLPEGASVQYYARIPTEQTVAFITIDDGQMKRPEACELLKQAGVPVTLFLMIDAIKTTRRTSSASSDRRRHRGAHAHPPEPEGQVLRGPAARRSASPRTSSGSWYGRRRGPLPPALRREGRHDAEGRPRLRHARRLLLEGNRRQGHRALPVRQHGPARRHHPDALPRPVPRRLHRRPQAIKAAGLTPALLEDYIP